MISMDDIKDLIRETELPHPPTIILWGQDDLLMQAVASLVTSQQNWRVIRISDQADDAELTEQVQAVNPQVLIVHQDTFFGNLRLLIRFVQTCSELKIITINLDNNRLEIFNKQTMHLKTVSDLMSIIAEDIHIAKGGNPQFPTSFSNPVSPAPCAAKNKKEE